jgi:hypothetical protein
MKLTCYYLLTCCNFCFFFLNFMCGIVFIPLGAGTKKWGALPPVKLFVKFKVWRHVQGLHDTALVSIASWRLPYP